MDEITLTAETAAAEVTPEGVRLFTITPEELGLTRCTMADLRGGDAIANALIVRSVLLGETGPRRDIVLLNAAYALQAANACSTVQDGLAMAACAIDSGKAAWQLNQLITLTNE